LDQSLSDAEVVVVDPLIREASFFVPFVKIERSTFGATVGCSATLPETILNMTVAGISYGLANAEIARRHVIRQKRR
jgi:hypothetical protein